MVTCKILSHNSKWFKPLLNPSATFRHNCYFHLSCGLVSKPSLPRLVSKPFQRKDQLSIDEDRFPIPQPSPISFDTSNLSHPLRPNVKLELFSFFNSCRRGSFYVLQSRCFSWIHFVGFCKEGHTIWQS